MAIALEKDDEMAAHWKTQIEQCDKATDKWRKRAEKISKNYRDERDEQDKGAAKRLNLYWANVQTLKPAIYSKTPVPIAERRFLDKDTTGRVASSILERVLRYEVSMSGFDSTIRRARNDYLGGPGRGQVWVRYNPKFGESISPEQTADDDITETDSGEAIVDEPRDEEVEAQEREFLSESLAVDYVHWQDFYIFPANARTWIEVEGVGRRLFMSRDDMKDAGFKDWKTIALDHVPKMDGQQGGESLVSGQQGMQATIFEIWWKPEKRIYFVSKTHTKTCKEVDDPLHLEKFFPCPEPLSATMTNDTMIPVPDYAESQDQYIQIDDLTKRIDILVAACKVVGVYDAATEGLKRVFEEAQEPNLIAIDSWAAFAEKGGIEGALSLVPIKQIADVLKILIETRQQIIEDLDRTTGVSDIMRGTSDARETMGGQRLKSNNSSQRLQERQDDMARFCRDIICIMGEIVSEHFDPQTLVQISGALNDEGLDPPDLPPVQSPPISPMMGHNGGPPLQSPPALPQGAQPPAMMPPQVQTSPPAGQQPAGMMAPPGAPPPMPQPIPETPEQKMQRKMELIASAIALLRQDKLRGFRIDIETDSTVQGDAQMEKAQRIEFVEGVTKFIQAAGEIAMQLPEFTPLAGKMLAFAVRGFRVGRDLESAIEDFIDSTEKQAKEKASQPPQPNADQIKAETEKMKAQAEIERQQVENQGEQANATINLQSKQIDLEMRKLELQIKMLDFNGKRVEAAAAAKEAGQEPDEVGVHPHMALKQIGDAAQVFDIASRRNAAPKIIHRGPDGKATHITTDFQEQQ